jgi:hypothetical protein
MKFDLHFGKHPGYGIREGLCPPAAKQTRLQTNVPRSR